MMKDQTLLLLSLAEHDSRIFFTFDRNSKKFIYTNPAFKAFAGISGSDVQIEKLLAMIHPDDYEYLKECYANLQPKVFKDNIEFRVVLSGQKEHVLRLAVFCAQEQKANVLIGYAEDITQYKEHNNKLNEFSNKKNAVLNVLSHDLAGPLGSIQNLSALISRKTKLLEDQDLNKWLTLIENISKKSIHLIQEFVKQEFIETQGAALVKNRINLVMVLKTFMEEYQQSESEMHQHFHFETSNAHIFVEIDEAKFAQAINNLISNAVKFTPDDGSITIGLEEKENTVLIRVADTGIGIPEKFHADLFDKFNTARRTGLKGEPSVGLGMSIIKTIIEWHNGKIWFESAVDKGTTFYIEIDKCV